MINDQHVVVPSHNVNTNTNRNVLQAGPFLVQCWRFARSLFWRWSRGRRKDEGAISRKQSALLGPAMIKLEDAAG